MSLLQRAGLLVLLASLFAGCGDGGGDASSDSTPLVGYVEGQSYGLEWSFDQPPRVGEVEFSLSAERLGDSAAADDALGDPEVTVAAFMPGHAHGLPDTPPVTMVEPGLYEVSGLVLTMTGTWGIEVTVRDGDVTEQLGFSIDVE